MTKKRTFGEVPKEYLIDMKGKKFVLYRGLIALAHAEGLKELYVKILQYPTEGNGNTCICEATANFGVDRNGSFQDIGDASPSNVGSMIKPHLIRMASTRAKARVLRDALGIGECSLEELGGDEEPEKKTKKRNNKKKEEKKEEVKKEESTGSEKLSCEELGKKIAKTLYERTGKDKELCTTITKDIFGVETSAGLANLDHSTLLSFLNYAQTETFTNQGEKQS